jgi:hypothetical protein
MHIVIFSITLWTGIVPYSPAFRFCFSFRLTSLLLISILVVLFDHSYRCITVINGICWWEIHSNSSTFQTLTTGISPSGCSVFFVGEQTSSPPVVSLCFETVTGVNVSVFLLVGKFVCDDINQCRIGIRLCTHGETQGML